MVDDKIPSDILKELGNDTKTPTDINLPVRKTTVTKTSAKVDEGVTSIDEKVRNWQESINNWRLTITQNEKLIVTFCVILGSMYSYAINECTRDLNFAWYVYGLFIALFITSSALLIAGGELPLVVIIKFVVAFAIGHVAMMYLIAVDGHTWQILTTDVCKYPATVESIMFVFIGVGIGYIFKTFEEIRSVDK